MILSQLSTELRPRLGDPPGATTYLLHDPPLSLFSEGNTTTVRFETDAGNQPRVLLTIPANPTGPERVYVFTPLTADGTPGP